MSNTNDKTTGESSSLDGLVSLQERFNKIVFDMDGELTEAKRKIAELESKVRIAEFANTASNCGKCGDYKNLPWKDDDHGYVCVSCAVAIAEGKTG